MKWLLPALVVLGSCSAHVAEDARAYVYMNAAADALANSASKPRWEWGSNTAAIDEAAFLDDEHVVLGLGMNVSLDTMGFPVREGLLEFDANSGKPLWLSQAMPINVSSVVAAGARRVLTRTMCSQTARCEHLGDRLYLVWDSPAISGDAPAQMAHFRVEAGFRASSTALTADGTKVILLDQAHRGGTLAVFDVDKGKVWEDVDPAAALAPATMSVGEKDVAAWRSAVVDYDAATGARRWTAAAPGLITEGSQLVRGNGVLLAMRGDGRIWIINARSGSLREADGLPTPATSVASGDEIYQLRSDFREILALRQTDGATLFRVSLPTPANGAIVVAGGVVAVPVTTGVAFYSAKDGRALGVVSLDTGAPPRRLPDQMVVHGDTLIVAYETGVAAIDLRALKPRWSYKVLGAPPTFLDQRLPQTLFELADWGIAAPKDVDSTLALKFVAATSGEPVTMQPIQGNTASGAFDLGNSRLSAAANRTAGVADFSMIVTSTNVQIAAMAEAHHASEINTQISNAKFRLPYALRVFASALQGNYYVRPIGWLRGAGYFVVDLRNGAWTEILTSPRQYFQDDFSADFPLGVISPRGDYLLTSAISFDRSHWLERTRDSKHPIFPIADEPRHLARFDIPSGSFAPPSSYPTRSIVIERSASSAR